MNFHAGAGMLSGVGMKKTPTIFKTNKSVCFWMTSQFINLKEALCN